MSHSEVRMVQFHKNSVNSNLKATPVFVKSAYEVISETSMGKFCISLKRASVSYQCAMLPIIEKLLLCQNCKQLLSTILRGGTFSSSLSIYNLYECT